MWDQASNICVTGVLAGEDKMGIPEKKPTK